MTMLKGGAKTFYRNTIILAMIAGLFLFVANSAVWVNRYLFDRKNFTDITVTSLSSESSRDAIASEVVNRTLSDAPLARKTLGGTAEKVVTGLLGTDQFHSALENVARTMHIYFTSENRQTIAIDFAPTKQVISLILSALQRISSGESRVIERVYTVPDRIVILNKDTLPSFYTQSVVLLWAGPIAGILAMILLVIPYVMYRRRYVSIAIIQGITIVSFGVLVLLVGPLFRPLLLANIPTENAHIVVENLYNAFIQTFNAQSSIFIGVGALAILFVLVLCGGRIMYGRYGNKITQLGAKKTKKSYK